MHEDTQADFVLWIKDSKVADADGKPLKFFHGTSREFSVFDSARSGQNFSASSGGFFFSDEKAVAEQLADYTAENDEDEKPGAAPRVMEVYLSLKNPLIKDFKSQSRTVNIRAFIAKAIKDGHDGAIMLNARDSMPAWRANQYVAFRPEQIRLATPDMTLSQRMAAAEDARDFVARLAPKKAVRHG